MKNTKQNDNSTSCNEFVDTFNQLYVTLDRERKEDMMSQPRTNYKSWEEFDIHWMLETLLPMIQYPFLISHIDQETKASIEENGFFDWNTYQVSDAGREFVAKYAHKLGLE